MSKSLISNPPYNLKWSYPAFAQEQHIFYLNEEENRYLAELRDALLPELMSGKIDVEKLKGDDMQ